MTTIQLAPQSVSVTPCVWPSSLLVHGDVARVAAAMIESCAAVTSLLVIPALGASLMRVQWVGLRIELDDPDGGLAKTMVTTTLTAADQNDAGQMLTIRSTSPAGLSLLWRWQSHAPRRSRRHTRQAPRLDDSQRSAAVPVAIGLVGATVATMTGAHPSVFTDAGLARMAGLPTAITSPVAIIAVLLDAMRMHVDSCLNVDVELHDVAYVDDQLTFIHHNHQWMLLRADTGDVIATASPRSLQ